jgi:carbonyl reductase 1
LESINRFAKYLKEKHDGIDILVNNAAIAFKVTDTTPFHIQAEKSVTTNLYGTLNVCDALFPLLRSHARVVNVSSRAGMLKIVSGQSLRHKLSNDNATLNDVQLVLNEFIE